MSKIKSTSEPKKASITVGNRPTSTGSSNSLSPKFCFHYLDKNNFNLTDCDKKQKAEILTKLHLLSQLTWQQISNNSRTANGCEQIPFTQIKRPKPTIADEDRAMCFRFSGRGRFLGIKRDETLHIIWIDPDHKLYD